MFLEKLHERSISHNTRLCIGLDPDVDFICHTLGFNSVGAFNQSIIDATADLALCYKPQIAHYSAYGLEGDLLDTIDAIHKKDRHLTVILDAKRGDIGSTAQHYATEAFQRYRADAVTVNPYLGFDSIAPFLAHEGCGVVVLARTSNASSAWLQCQIIDQQPLYLRLAKQLDAEAKHNDRMLFVVGATDPHAIAQMREAFPDRWLLIPGVGAQGGDIEAVIRAGGNRLIINVSRAILYPQWDGKQDYFERVRQAALQLTHQILASV